MKAQNEYDRLFLLMLQAPDKTFKLESTTPQQIRVGLARARNRYNEARDLLELTNNNTPITVKQMDTNICHVRFNRSAEVPTFKLLETIG